MSEKSGSVGRAELVALLCEQHQLEKPQAVELLETILETMIQTLASGQSIKIPGFGTFLTRQKKARYGRNPRTGEETEVTARRVVVLRPSSLLKDMLEKK